MPQKVISNRNFEVKKELRNFQKAGQLAAKALENWTPPCPSKDLTARLKRLESAIKTS